VPSYVCLESLAPEHRKALQRLYYKPLPERLDYALLDDLRSSQYPHVCGAFSWVLREIMRDEHMTPREARRLAEEALTFEAALKEALNALRELLIAQAS